MTAALLALGVAAWPAYVLAGFISMIPGIFDWLVPNAEARRQEARASLRCKLLETLVEPRAQIATQFEDVLRQLRDQISASLQQSLSGSRLALLAFNEQLVASQAELHQQASILN